MSEYMDYLSAVAPYVDKIDELKERIVALEADNAALKARLGAHQTLCGEWCASLHRVEQ